MISLHDLKLELIYLFRILQLKPTNVFKPGSPETRMMVNVHTLYREHYLRLMLSVRVHHGMVCAVANNGDCR